MLLQKQNSRELQRKESELTQPIVLCDVSANRYWNLLYCNDAFTQVTGQL